MQSNSLYIFGIIWGFTGEYASRQLSVGQQMHVRNGFCYVMILPPPLPTPYLLARLVPSASVGQAT